MDRELAAFLESRTADFEERVAWRGGAHRLHLRGYLTRAEPPDAFLIAGRALVLDEERDPHLGAPRAQARGSNLGWRPLKVRTRSGPD